MRYLFLLFGVLFSLLFVSCQQETMTTESPPKPTVSGASSEQKSLQPFEDTTALFNGRVLLITYMTDVENLFVPTADSWEPDETYMDGEWQVHRFKSGEWLLTMANLREETDPSMFRIRLSGPNDFNYTVEIFADGTVMPNQ